MVWSKALARAVRDEQKSSQGFRDALGYCSACVKCLGSAAQGEEERRAGGEMGSAGVVFVMSCTGPSVGAPAHSVTAFTHIVGSRASPRQEGGDTLTSDGCLSIIPLEQAEQEELRGFTRMGTAQLPAFPPEDCEKGFGCRGGSECRQGLGSGASHPPLWVVLLPAGPAQLAGCAAPGSSPAVGTSQRSFKESFLSFLFIYGAYFARANLYLSSSVYEGPHKAAQPPEKLMCALHLLSLITEGKQWR